MPLSQSITNIADAVSREPLLPEWQSHPPNADVRLKDSDFLDKKTYSLAPKALERLISKLTEFNIGFVRIPDVDKLYPDAADREAFTVNLPFDVFRYAPMAFIQAMERDLPVHPHGANLLQASQERPEDWFEDLRVSFTHGNRDHGARFTTQDDTIFRGHYAHHEYTGEERRDDEVVLFLVNGYWDFQQIEGTEPVVMDMEAYRRASNAEPGRNYQPQQPRTIGGQRDLEFLPNDPRRRYSYIPTADYSRQADIFILNNLRVGHSRMPGQWIPPYESVRRPLYQCSFNIGFTGNLPALDYIEEASLYKKDTLKNNLFRRLEQIFKSIRR